MIYLDKVKRKKETKKGQIFLSKNNERNRKNNKEIGIVKQEYMKIFFQIEFVIL